MDESTKSVLGATFALLVIIVFTWALTMMSCEPSEVKSFYVRPASGQYCVAESVNAVYDPCVTKPLSLEDATKVANALNRDIGNYASWNNER
jgi:hypothetical protein